MSTTIDNAGFTYVWSYEVRGGCEVDFESLYGPGGGWAKLFRQSPDYLGTNLLRDRKNKNRYVTIDGWDSEEAHRRFVSEHRLEFEALDRQGEALTQSETLIGHFDPAGS